MISKIKAIKNWFLSKSIVLDESMPTPKAPTEQCNVRDAQTRKRVAAAFKAQESQMNARALVSHDPVCENIDKCKKKNCFKFKPDKIVSDPYTIKKVVATEDHNGRVLSKTDKWKKNK